MKMPWCNMIGVMCNMYISQDVHIYIYMSVSNYFGFRFQSDPKVANLSAPRWKRKRWPCHSPVIVIPVSLSMTRGAHSTQVIIFLQKGLFCSNPTAWVEHKDKFLWVKWLVGCLLAGTITKHFWLYVELVSPGCLWPTNYRRCWKSWTATMMASSLRTSCNFVGTGR